MSPADGTLSENANGELVVRFERIVPRPVAKVWAALTDPKILSNWLGKVEIEPRVGGKFVLAFHGSSTVMTGAITAIEPPRVLEHTWLENTVSVPQSLVRWELSAAGGDCRLVLTHRFPKGCAAKDILSFLGGWEALLDVLAEASDGTAMPYKPWEPLDALYRAKYP